MELVDGFLLFLPPRAGALGPSRQFESELLKVNLHSTTIKETHTAPYRPQGNGTLERFNRLLVWFRQPKSGSIYLFSEYI